MPRSEQDVTFLKNVPLGTIEAFRDQVGAALMWIDSENYSHEIQVYTKAFTERNASKFLSNSWIDINELKEFISRTNGGHGPDGNPLCIVLLQ